MRRKRILCFGDSNTWGLDGRNGRRFDEDTRWTGRLQTALGPGYAIIEEGLNGRTILSEDPILGGKAGGPYLLTCLDSQKPLDLLVLMLGTNDLKARFGLTSFNICQSMDTLLRRIKGFADYDPLLRDMKILLLSPPHLGEKILETSSCDNFRGEVGVRYSRELAEYYQLLAERYGCAFLDAARFAAAGPPDYLHLDGENHARLAAALADLLPGLLEEK